jgi:outer membrane protein OmpA-like peptidoglycan-associated protein
MIQIRAIASAIGFAAIMMTGVGPATAADEKQNATLTMSHDSAGIGIGWHSGEGKLTLADGSEYAVTMDAYSIAGLGFANVISSGKVFNLEKVSDLTGEYTGTGESASFRKGEGKAILKNDANNVRIEMASKQSGVRAGIGIGSISFKLGKQLKGSNAPPPVAFVPMPEPVVATPVKAVVKKPVLKPTEYKLLFGFNKARVNLATGRVLDSIVTDWKNKAQEIQVIGHADMVGSDKYNMVLSQKRANAVMRALVARGVPASRVTAIGVGQKQLAVPTKKGQRLRANRRVELRVITKK